MEPERPSELDSDEARWRLGDLPLGGARKRALGDRLEAAARARIRRRRTVMVLGAVGLAAALALVVHRVRPLSPVAIATHLRTGPADFQLLPLGDRGVAFVSEETELDVHLDRTPAVTVRRGSVRFLVRRHQGRPFVVATGAAEIVVVGTEFDVTVVGTGTEVTVVRGEVEVRNARGSRRLWPRESAQARPGEAPRMIVPPTSVVVDGPAEIVAPARSGAAP
jgi:transmembrane sensor